MLITILTLLILFSAFLSGSETALFSLSPMKVRSFRRSKDDRKKLVVKILKSPLDLLVTLLMLNVIMNILIQNVVSSIFGTFSGYLVTVGIPLLLTLVFGEVIPKSIAMSSNAAFSIKVAPFINKAMRFFSPIRIGLTKLTKFISHNLFFFLKKEKKISIPMLIQALKTSKEYGVISKDEAKLITGYLQLEEDLVKEHARPRQEIVYFDLNHDLDELVKLFVDEEVTRLPVCDGNLESLKGIIDSRDYFIHGKELKKGHEIKKFLRRPFFVPETMSAHLLLRQMYEKEESLAILVDEYGSIGGLITLEDLVEVVIGEIADRRDEKPSYTRPTDEVVIASGKLELSEFESLFGIPIESDSNVVTIGGYLTEKMGDIPKSGEKYVTDDFLFHILASTPTRVRRIYIRRLHSVRRR
ncbi:MAG: hemolysin family protein [Simkaniaceae bacterium]